jgi:hypothetical protein
MRKPAIITVASLGLLGLAGSSAWACDDDGYRQTRVYRYSSAPRAYGYYAPTYGYRSAYLDDDDYDYGYGYGAGGVAVGVNVGRDRRFHRRQFTRSAVYGGERSGRIREGTARASSGRDGAAFRGAGSGEGGRGAGAAGMSGGMGTGGMGGRGGDGGGRR